ncbi:MAG: DUF2793 domain-containing protein [Tabrizicola sp.]
MPLIAAQQNQPEVTHNEALLLMQGVWGGVVGAGANTPPGSPADGDAHIVGPAPTGAWAGRANTIAVRIGGAWRFLPGNNAAGTPIAIGARHAGLTVFDRSSGLFRSWTGSSWQVLLARPVSQRAEAGTAYTLADADLIGGITIRMTAGAANTITVPAGLGGNQPVEIVQSGAGQTSFVAGVGATIQSESGWLKLRAQHTRARLLPIGSDTFLLTGDLVA